MFDYFNAVMSQFGIPPWAFTILILIMIWSSVWKLFALWTAARKNSVVWFVVLALVNTVGILEILYIFVFSKMKQSQRSSHNRKRRR
ncbi:Uncharacterised protein [uncultured archaeon]|nr:Uncharacterised protein [uncultured archaeon]